MIESWHSTVEFELRMLEHFTTKARQVHGRVPGMTMDPAGTRPWWVMGWSAVTSMMWVETDSETWWPRTPPASTTMPSKMMHREPMKASSLMPHHAITHSSPGTFARPEPERSATTCAARLGRFRNTLTIKAIRPRLAGAGSIPSRSQTSGNSARPGKRVDRPRCQTQIRPDPKPFDRTRARPGRRSGPALTCGESHPVQHVNSEVRRSVEDRQNAGAEHAAVNEPQRHLLAVITEQALPLAEDKPER